MRQLARLFGSLTVAFLLSVVPGFCQYSALCGQTVTSDVVLTETMTCSLRDGLIVGADGITINLNGQTIQCWGAYDVPGCQYVDGPTGINTNGFSNVKIVGPGTIQGFHTGVRIPGGARISVRDVKMDGPSGWAWAQAVRNGATGILIQNTACPTTVIDGNTVLNHQTGVKLETAQCVKLAHNTMQYNSSITGESHGIHAVNSGDLTITVNQVKENGLNIHTYAGGGLFDGGITVEGTLAGVAGSRITQNYVAQNCGDGISTRNAAADNTIANNEARYNNPDMDASRCYGHEQGVVFDLADRNTAPGANKFAKTNDCRTAGPGIPAGVCALDE